MVQYDYCIFGGSFNPVTSGHFINEDKSNLVSPDHRINLLNIALKTHFPNAANISVSQFETDYGGSGESYITLQRLKREYPNKTFVFVIGSDVVPKIPMWSMGLEFARAADVIIASREGYPIEKKDLAIFNKYYLLDDLLVEKNMERRISGASSTQARELISDGDMKRVNDYLGDEVTKYIVDHKLYACTS